VEEPKLIAEKVALLNTFKRGKVYLKISSNSPNNTFDKLKYILRKYNGETPVYVYMEKEKRTVVADRSLWIDIESEEAIAGLKKVLGEESVKIS
jgi:DNA polymerase-3 subunit alpha